MNCSIAWLKCQKCMSSIGMQFYFREILGHKQLMNKKSTINEPKMVHSQDAFTDLYKNCLVLT